MKIPFRQGIVRSQLDVTQNPNFLQNTGVGMSLLTDNAAFVVSFAHGETEYNHTEENTVTNAWPGIFQPTNDYYFYIDIDLITAARTFGYTTILPDNGAVLPTSPVDGQHFFNNTTNKMMVYNAASTSWAEAVRIFVGKLTSGTIIDYIYPIGDSQIGISRSLSTLPNHYPSGRIVFDNSNAPIKKANGEFFTTEDRAFVGNSKIESIRLESNITEAISNQNMSAFSVIRLENTGKMSLANYADTDGHILAIVPQSVVVNQSAPIIVQGAVTNPSWQSNNWNINDKLWVKDNGELVNEDPNTTDFLSYPEKQVPIARVLAKDSIIFEQGLGGVGKTGTATGATVDPATDVEFGTVKLLTPSSSTVVVSDDDPRLLGGPFAPLVHGHAASDVTVIPTGDITATDAQGAFADVATNKLAVAGGTMTGNLILDGDPTLDLQAATKAYVDGLVNGLNWIDAVQYISLIGDNLTTPPAFPNFSDAYLVALGAGGAWAGLDEHLVIWDGGAWIDIGLRAALPTGTRIGVSVDSATPASGTFAGLDNQIATLDDPILGTWSFYVPIANEAFMVNNPASVHAYHGYVYNGSNWAEFSGPGDVIGGTNILVEGHTISVHDFGTGGTVDARYLQGLEPSAFVAVAGDTMTGDLILNADPTTNLMAATKQYVDNASSSLWTEIGSDIYYTAGGVVVGAPTEGPLGIGTINAEGIYINGVEVAYLDTPASGWDSATSVFNGIEGNVGLISGGPMRFAADGTSFYIQEQSPAGQIYQRTCAAGAWDVSGVNTFLAGPSLTEETAQTGFDLSRDGTKLYVVGTNNTTVYQYTLSTPWDMTTVSYDSISFAVTGQTSDPSGLMISDDGTRMFVGDNVAKIVYQYNLGTPYNVSTAVYSGNSVAVVDFTDDLFIGDGGTELYTGCFSGSSSVKRYTMSTPWDLSSATFTSSWTVVGTSARPRGLCFKTDGLRMFFFDGAGLGRAVQFDLAETVAAVSGNITHPWEYSGSDIYFNTGKVSIGTISPHMTAEVQIDSTTGGFLPPRMTTGERDTISGYPANGLMIYNSTLDQMQVYNGTTWANVINPDLYRTADGTAIAPAYGFAAEEGVGIYRDGVQTLKFASNNIERMTLASDGGLHMTGATGSSQGAGTINATGLYVNGVAVATGGAHPDPHLLSDGLQATPTYSFSGETGTGMYRAAGRLSFTNGGNDVMSLFANSTVFHGSAVGISPQNTMHIHENSNSSGGIRITNNQTGSSGSDGFNLGINNSEQAEIRHFENTDFILATNSRSTDIVIRSNGSVDFGNPAAGSAPDTPGIVNAKGLYVEGVAVTPSNTNGYKHTQGVASTTWSINHALGTEFIQVTVYVDLAGTWTQLIPLSVEIVDANNVDVKFTGTQVGRAVIVGVA